VSSYRHCVVSHVCRRSGSGDDIRAAQCQWERVPKLDPLAIWFLVVCVSGSDHCSLRTDGWEIREYQGQKAKNRIGIHSVYTAQRAATGIRFKGRAMEIPPISSNSHICA